MILHLFGSWLGFGLVLGLVTLFMVAVVAFWTFRKKSADSFALEAKHSVIKPALWRRRRQRRVRRHLRNRLKNSKGVKTERGPADEEKERHLKSRYANPKIYVVSRLANKEKLVAAFFQRHRMKRCARRATARERARIRLHSRAHDRKLRHRMKLDNRNKRSALVVSKKTEELKNGRLNVDGQKRMRSKFSTERLYPYSTTPDYWQKILTLPVMTSKQVERDGKVKGKVSKESVSCEGFVPSNKRINSLMKKLQDEPGNKELQGEGKKGMDCNWPISLEMLYEQFPKSYPNVDKLEKAIAAWRQLGIFRLESQVREMRTTSTWDYGNPNPAASSPSRVKLNTQKWILEKDSVNATYFGPSEDRQRFICSPAPDKSWDYEFWTMLADHHVKCIVQLNNWDYRRPVLDQKEYFVPFERQHYVSSRSSKVYPTKKESKDNGSKRASKATAEKIVSQIEYYQKCRKCYKLGRGRKRGEPGPRRRLSVKRGPAGGTEGENARKKKSGRGRTSRSKCGREKASKRENVEKKSRSWERRSNTSEMPPTKSKDFSGDLVERRKARKLRRKLRREMRRIGQDGANQPEIFVKKLSVLYLFPTPRINEDEEGVHLRVKRCRHPNKRDYWRLAMGNATATDSFLVRATLLRLVCRKHNINHKLVHFQVFNYEPYESPDIAHYQCLIQLVNKIAGTVSVISEHGLSRGPTFCLSAMLLQQLKTGSIPDPLKLFTQLQVDRPGSLLRPLGYFVALRTMLEYVKQHQKQFKLKEKANLDKLLGEIKLALACKRL